MGVSGDHAVRAVFSDSNTLWPLTGMKKSQTKTVLTAQPVVTKNSPWRCLSLKEQPLEENQRGKEVEMECVCVCVCEREREKEKMKI